MSNAVKSDGWPRRRPLTVTDHHIRFEVDTGLGMELVCPRCGSNYLHSGQVTVFDRPEDHERTTISVVHGGLVASHLVPSQGTDNPSSRRQAVTIAFFCEGCQTAGPVELTLAQHKGNTFLTWRYDPISDAEDEIGTRMRDEGIGFVDAIERIARARGLTK